MFWSWYCSEIINCEMLWEIMLFINYLYNYLYRLRCLFRWIESISREWLWVIQISMHQGTKLPWLGPRGQGFTLELWAVLLPSFAKRSLRAVHIAKTKVKKHQPGRGGQGGTKNIDALQHYSSSQSCSGRRLNSFVQLLADSCVLEFDYVSYPVSCIDSPVGVFKALNGISLQLVHEELPEFLHVILNHVLSDIIIYYQIFIYIYTYMYIFRYIFRYYQIIGFKSFIVTPLFRLECGLELRWS